MSGRLTDRFSALSWRARALVFLVGLALFIIFMDWIAMPLYTRHGAEYELPDVTEKSITDAADNLEQEGFIPIVQDSVWDSFYPEGTVVRQNPPPYSTVKKGRRVYLVVSSGERPIEMPNLIKESLTNAELRLRAAGLILSEVFYEYSDAIPYRDVVVKQSVAPDEIVKHNQRIDLTVSLGPSPSSMVIPRLVGKSERLARNELLALGLTDKQIQIAKRYQPNLVPGTVLAQSIAEGVPVSDVGFIIVTVSTDQ